MEITSKVIFKVAAAIEGAELFRAQCLNCIVEEIHQKRSITSTFKMTIHKRADKRDEDTNRTILKNSHKRADRRDEKTNRTILKNNLRQWR